MSLPVSYLTRAWLGSKISTTLLPSTIRPLSAHIKLTENCQAKCISCDYWKTRWQDKISTPRAIDLINDLIPADIRTLRLTGGEPVRRKDRFPSGEKTNSSRCKQIILNTNSLLINNLH